MFWCTLMQDFRDFNKNEKLAHKDLWLHNTLIWCIGTAYGLHLWCFKLFLELDSPRPRCKKNKQKKSILDVQPNFFFCVRWSKKVIRVWNDMRMSKWWCCFLFLDELWSLALRFIWDFPRTSCWSDLAFPSHLYFFFFFFEVLLA